MKPYNTELLKKDLMNFCKENNYTIVDLAKERNINRGTLERVKAEHVLCLRNLTNVATIIWEKPCKYLLC